MLIHSLGFTLQIHGGGGAFPVASLRLDPTHFRLIQLGLRTHFTPELSPTASLSAGLVYLLYESCWTYNLTFARIRPSYLSILDLFLSLVTL